MDSIERIIRATPLPINLPYTGNGQNAQRALVHASLATAVGRKGRHLTGTFCLTGDTMEGIIQCLVFLKAFSVSSHIPNPLKRISFIEQIFRFLFLSLFAWQQQNLSHWIRMCFHNFDLSTLLARIHAFSWDYYLNTSTRLKRFIVFPLIASNIIIL